MFRAAMFWAVFGIVYNVLEGVLSTWIGLSEETLALFGFGLDSFIEAVSAVSIGVMVARIWQSPDSGRGRFEATSLWVTGWCFHLLAIGLVIGALLNLWQGNRPQTTWPGVVISTVSIAVMWVMLSAKLRIGRQLKSDAMVADARCTQVCIYMSIVLLASSALYELTAALLGVGLSYIDGLGALAIAYFSYREGAESLDKASGKHTCCRHGCE